MANESNGWHWQVSNPAVDPVRILATRSSVVKSTPLKTVTFHETEQGSFYVKRYLHHRAGLRPYKYWFKPSQARNEWNLAQELVRREVPCVEHVALGEHRTWRGIRESILITRAFNGVPLNRWSGDWQLVRKFINQVHEKGVLQKDLHPENILIEPQSGELRLVDLHGTELFEALTEEQRKDNLAYASIFLPLTSDPEMLKRRQHLRRLAYRERSWRCLKRNRDFIFRKFGSAKWHVRLDALTPQLEALLKDPDKAFNDPNQLLKSGRSATVVRQGSWVIKRYNFKKPLNLIKDIFRKSKAVNGYVKGYHLELVNVPTARSIAVCDVRILGFLVESYLITEFIHGGSLREILRTGSSGTVEKNVAAALARLHQEGFSHRDLKETNIIIRADGSAVLIDLDGLSDETEVDRTRTLKDLGRFCEGVQHYQKVTPADRHRFFKRYLTERRSISLPR